MIAAALTGALAGLAIPFVMWRAGMLRERSGLAILVGAVAVFYPVFAVANAASPLHIAAHLAIAAAFCALAIAGFRRGALVLISALALHGLFDLVVLGIAHPAPAWWPIFCASLDLAAAALLLTFLRPGIVQK